MRVGAVTQEVQVTTEAPLIETSTPGVGQVINAKTVQEIPLNGRHFVDLNLLTPGTVTPPANGFLTAPLRGQGSFAINTAGQREDTTNWLVNGINLNDPVQNQVTFQPPDRHARGIQGGQFHVSGAIRAQSGLYRQYRHPFWRQRVSRRGLRVFP